MKAGMYYSNSNVAVEELEKPKAGDNDIVIKVHACGICGSDLMEWYRIKKAPLVLGHELAGDVVEVGSSVTDFKAGDRVFSTHHVPCGECIHCLHGHTSACTVFQTVNNHTPGGFSEFLKVKGQSLKTGTFTLPDELSYDQATFIEPLGTTVRGLRAAGLRPGDSIVILGSGIIGLIMIKLAKALGAGTIIATDMSDNRLRAAKEFGADIAIKADTDVPAQITQEYGRLADKVMLCTGALPAAKQALACVDKGGTVTFFAVPRPGEELHIDFNPLWRNDITIKTCYGADPLDNIQAMELLRTGRVVVDDMITDRVPLSDIQNGFQKAAKGDACLKVIVYPHIS
jgi:L-iditol 2-dehydrogenase